MERELEDIFEGWTPGEVFYGLESELPVIDATKNWVRAENTPKMWVVEALNSPLARNWLELEASIDGSYQKETCFLLLQWCFQHSGDILIRWDGYHFQLPAPRGYAWLPLNRERVEWIKANADFEFPNLDKEPNMRLVPIETYYMPVHYDRLRAAGPLRSSAGQILPF